MLRICTYSVYLSPSESPLLSVTDRGRIDLKRDVGERGCQLIYHYTAFFFGCSFALRVLVLCTFILSPTLNKGQECCLETDASDTDGFVALVKMSIFDNVYGGGA